VVSYEVFVVDNNSQDGSAEMVRTWFPQVKLTVNRKNLGFAKANNQAIKQSAGTYLLLLNSDVEVEAGSFDKTVEYMNNNPTVGILGCRVVKPDGTLDLACRRSFPTPMNSLYLFTGLSALFPKSRFASYNLTYLPEDQIAEVDSVMGAFLLIRRGAVDKVGTLDEDFFMYGEDIDWCYRVKMAGYKVMYVPITRVVHYKGSSSRKASRRSLYEFHRAMVLFYDKHYRGNYNFLVTAFVRFGVWLRYGFKVIQNSLRREKYVSK
jgi:GT2 family glycosyltransferase